MFLFKLVVPKVSRLNQQPRKSTFPLQNERKQIANSDEYTFLTPKDRASNPFHEYRNS